jgi:hypothetical protein
MIAFGRPFPCLMAGFGRPLSWAAADDETVISPFGWRRLRFLQ